MPDLTIEHDPDSGCAGCPMRRGMGLVCTATDRRFEAQHLRPAESGIGWSAPDWCPLRTARVVVQRPQTERPCLSPVLALLADVARGGWETSDGRPIPPESAEAAMAILDDQPGGES